MAVGYCEDCGLDYGHKSNCPRVKKSGWTDITKELPELEETVLFCHFRDGQLLWMASGQRTDLDGGIAWMVLMTETFLFKRL